MFLLLAPRPPSSTLFPYTTLFRSHLDAAGLGERLHRRAGPLRLPAVRLRQAEGPRHRAGRDRKSTRLNSSHLGISYAVFCLKKKNTKPVADQPPTAEESTCRPRGD